MIIHRMLQGSDEWHEIRKCKLTASKATAIGNSGAGLNTYIDEIILSMFIPKDNYVSKDMDRGNELEPIARIKYEMEFNCTVEEVGFIEYDKYSGYSPDGLVESDGLIEIKTRNDKIHYELLKSGKVDSGTIWQMNMGLLITGRKWCDFVSFNPNFKQSLFVKRFFPDEIKIEKLKLGLIKGIELLKLQLDSGIIKFELGL